MAEKIKSYKDLNVWQKSMDLVEDIYKLTNNFPKQELYGITSQMRRAATGIPTNISEGQQRRHIKEYVQFLYIAKSSAAELETLLTISTRLKYIDENQGKSIHDNLIEILKMLTILIGKLRSIQDKRIHIKSKT